jgi:hypothetical protein
VWSGLNVGDDENARYQLIAREPLREFGHRISASLHVIARPRSGS